MCDGTETSLFDCGFKKKDNCGKNEGAGVICSGILYILGQTIFSSYLCHFQDLQKTKGAKLSCEEDLTEKKETSF